MSDDTISRLRALDDHAPLSPDDLLAEVRRLGLATPGESAALVREARDRRLEHASLAVTGDRFAL